MDIFSLHRSDLNYSCACSTAVLRAYQQLNTPLGTFITSRYWSVLPTTSIKEVLLEMDRRDSDIAVVIDAATKLHGLFTKRDLLRRVVIPQLDQNQPISTVMTQKPVTLPTSALGYEAIVAMIQGGFHHVVLLEDRAVVGVVSEHDLFALQQVSLGQLAASINAAGDLEILKTCAAEIKGLVEYMFVQGVSPDQITRIISTLNDRLIQRVIDLETAGADLPDLRICWVIMGSEGRYEQTIATDQDNAIIFDHPKTMTPSQVRTVLRPLAERINHALDYIGFPLCKGQVMASNPDCCLSLSEWKRKFREWISEPTPDSLLKISIYFDFRPVHGHIDLADELRAWLGDAAQNQIRFLNQMAEIALQKSPPRSFLNTFFQEDHPQALHSTDIKVRGVTIFVDAARIYALASGILANRTTDRLQQAAKARQWPEGVVGSWVAAFNFLQGVRIRHQHNLRQSGLKSHNRLDLCKLNALEQKVCAEAFRQAAKLQKQMEADFLITNSPLTGA